MNNKALAVAVVPNSGLKKMDIKGYIFAWILNVSIVAMLKGNVSHKFDKQIWEFIKII